MTRFIALEAPQCFQLITLAIIEEKAVEENTLIFRMLEVKPID
jgi:hypothetical protein